MFCWTRINTHLKKIKFSYVVTMFLFIILVRKIKYALISITDIFWSLKWARNEMILTIIKQKSVSDDNDSFYKFKVRTVTIYYGINLPLCFVYVD